MKRGKPLARRTPLRRSMRRGKPSAYRTRARDLAYMQWVRRQPCCAKSVGGKCSGPIEADHAGRRGLSRKADDRTCIAICRLHHRQRTDFSGPFKTWDQAQMRTFLEDAITWHTETFNNGMCACDGACGNKHKEVSNGSR